MPVHACTGDGGKPGWQFGETGACYTYEAGNEAASNKAKQRAYIQAAAIEQSQRRRGETPKTVIELTISKQFETTINAPPVIDPQIMAKINAMAPEPVPPEQVYFAWAHLANDQYDRSFERFPVDYLQRFAETIVGKSLLPGHDRGAVPLGRWVAAEVVKGDDGATHLKAGFYVPARSDIAARVRMGVARDVSISYKGAQRNCDLCGSPYDGPKGCEHEKGRDYDGRICTLTYGGDTSRVEAIEGSLVWLGCQPGAQVVGNKAADPYSAVLAVKSVEERMEKSAEFVALEAECKVLKDENEELKRKAALAEDGIAYHTFLKTEIATKRAACSGKAEDVEEWLKTLDGATLPILRKQLELAQTAFDEKFPPAVQSKVLGNGEGRAAQAPEGSNGAPPEPQEFDPLASYKSFRAGAIAAERGS